MSRCDCGFDFVKAHIENQRLVSYVLIPHKNFRTSIRREYAIVVEKNAERKHRMVARASSMVGSLIQCPRCSSWLIDEPQRGKGFVVLQKTTNAAKTVQRTGTSRAARKTNSTPSAAGSRR